MLIQITNANFDLLSVGIAIAAIGVLGFAVYFSNRGSVTNRSFLFFSLMTIIWGVSNYLEYKFTTISSTLFALRFHLFISIWHAISFFQLSYVFPKDEIKFPKWYKFILLPVALVTSILTLTPFVFGKILVLAPLGEVTNPERGPGIILFVIVAFGLLIGALLILLVRTIKSQGLEKRQAASILIGMFLNACLILFFNVLLPVTFNDLRFIPFAALFVLPFIILTSYAIYKNKLFDIKVATTAFVAFLATAFSFVNIIYSVEISAVIINTTAFIIILLGSIQLIRAMIKLERLNDRLKELDQLKSEFVSLATHQIRAPLSAIKGYLSEVFEGDFGPVTPELEKPMRIVFQSTENLVHIVADFLNISRIEGGKMKYERAPLDLKQLVTDVMKELKPNLDRAGLEMKFVVPEGNYEVYGDIGKIKEVIGNLVDNSMKYTPHGSITITLSSDEKTQKVRFAISDTGIGIPAEVIPKLFQKFTRAKGANEVNIIGTGLGLYVAKLMIEGQDGRIWVESPGAGKGSTFIVELPAANIS